MTRIQALLDSIKKFTYGAKHPEIDLDLHHELGNCSLCDNAKSCYSCAMYKRWPSVDGSTVEKCAVFKSIWYKWAGMQNEDDEAILQLRSEYSLILVEAFEARLREVYKGDK